MNPGNASAKGENFQPSYLRLNPGGMFSLQGLACDLLIGCHHRRHRTHPCGPPPEDSVARDRVTLQGHPGDEGMSGRPVTWPGRRIY